MRKFARFSHPLLYLVVSTLLGVCRWTARLPMAGLAAFGAVAVARADVTKEYKIKAAFLYNFTKFVEWSPDRFPDGGAPIVIGVLGENPFGDELAAAVHDRKVNGRCIVIRSIRSPEDAQQAHVVFVTEGEERRFETMLLAKTDGVLTVGESRRFAAIGGAITFVAVEDKVRFEINMAAAEAAGLKISAQLQKLAVVVRKK